jgi:hypothetical protein
VTESQLQSAVIECARLLGWRCAHFRPAKTERGWRTPVQGDGKGFPDLVLVHMRQRRVLFVELKSAAGVVAAEQQDWLQRLMFAAGPNLGVYLWRPADWICGEVERVLRGEAPVPAESSTT